MVPDTTIDRNEACVLSIIIYHLKTNILAKKKGKAQGQGNEKKGSDGFSTTSPYLINIDLLTLEGWEHLLDFPHWLMGQTRCYVQLS